MQAPPTSILTTTIPISTTAILIPTIILEPNFTTQPQTTQPLPLPIFTNFTTNLSVSQLITTNETPQKEPISNNGPPKTIVQSSSIYELIPAYVPLVHEEPHVSDFGA